MVSGSNGLSGRVTNRKSFPTTKWTESSAPHDERSDFPIVLLLHVAMTRLETGPTGLFVRRNQIADSHQLRRSADLAQAKEIAFGIDQIAAFVVRLDRKSVV